MPAYLGYGLLIVNPDKNAITELLRMDLKDRSNSVRGQANS